MTTPEGSRTEIIVLDREGNGDSEGATSIYIYVTMLAVNTVTLCPAMVISLGQALHAGVKLSMIHPSNHQCSINNRNDTALARHSGNETGTCC